MSIKMKTDKWHRIHTRKYYNAAKINGVQL